MPGINGSFDATQYTPNQDFTGVHPVGKFPFKITNTSCEPTKDQQGGKFIVEFSTPAGKIFNNYNLWNQNPKAVDIARQELSALCYATGIFRLDFNNEGAALRSGMGVIEVGYQKGHEPTAEKPNGGYTEVKKVLDVNGNEPKAQASAAPAPQQAPMAAQPNAQPAGWGSPTTVAAPQQPAPAAPAAPMAWVQQPAAGGPAPAAESPPWAR